MDLTLDEALFTKITPWTSLRRFRIWVMSTHACPRSECCVEKKKWLTIYGTRHSTMGELRAVFWVSHLMKPRRQNCGLCVFGKSGERFRVYLVLYYGIAESLPVGVTLDEAKWRRIPYWTTVLGYVSQTRGERNASILRLPRGISTLALVSFQVLSEGISTGIYPQQQESLLKKYSQVSSIFLQLTYKFKTRLP